MNAKEEPIEFQVVDKRHFADPDSISMDTPVIEKPRYPSYVEELMARVSEMEKKFEEKKAQMAEETARTRSRLESDYKRRLELEKSKMLLPFLEVLDNLERAISASGAGVTDQLRKGLEMTSELFRAKLQAQAVEPIPVLDLPFDPNVGEAVGAVPVRDESKDGQVVEEVRKGYRMGETLVRPAQVRVGRFERTTQE